MNSGSKPTVFISSTCYDLTQVRGSLGNLITDNYGYDVLLSDQKTFPIDPNINPVDNCIRMVDERADILILIVGCRYGSISECGHSITNLEYIRAKAKGIPIYAFVNSSIIATLPLWKDNPEGDYHTILDTTKLFEFVDMLRCSENIWVFEFSSIEEITNTIRLQFAYLFYDSISIRHNTIIHALSPKVRSLKGRAFSIVINRPFGWEYKLYAQIIYDGLKGYSDLRHDLEHEISIKPMRYVQSLDEICKYQQVKVNELNHLISVLSKIFNRIFSIAIGEPGIEGDPEYIIYTAERFLHVYESIIAWGLDFCSILADEEYQDLINACIHITDPTLEDFDAFCNDFYGKVMSIPDNKEDVQEPIPLTATLTLRKPATSRFLLAIEQVKIRKGIMPLSDSYIGD